MSARQKSSSDLRREPGALSRELPAVASDIRQGRCALFRISTRFLGVSRKDKERCKYCQATSGSNMTGNPYLGIFQKIGCCMDTTGGEG